jgi:plastocyanin
MRIFGGIVIVSIAACSTWACSGSSYNSAPSAPTSSQAAAPAAGVATVNVVGVNGALSFSPNPATLPAGQMIVWHNIDSITHRVVLNDGSLDTGNLGPGASSQPMTLSGSGSQYHCSIHPEMIGSINQSTSTTAPAPTSY